ncbi:MAG TPA: hypothetical protein VND45_10320 [Thermoanaerobaculia bacterium]|jgi:hypothetical protein|nr:hypothetical protein [Thermoanaerobaculia bacterium]
MATQQSQTSGDPIRNHAASIGARIVDEGPDALFNEIENLLPEAWRDQIRAFPMAAVVLGVGVGVWLGMKKSDDIIAAGGALVSSAAMANVSQVMDKINKG